MERKLKKLTDVCSIQYGYAFSSKLFSDDSDNIAVIRIRNVKEGYSTTFYSGEYDESYVVNPGEILIGMDGEFNIAKWKSEPALLNQRVCKITGNDKVVEDYLQYYLSVELKEIERKTSFVTVKHLSAKALNAMELHLHPYDEQEKIANQLNLLRQIIDNRKVQLEEYDHLIKSRFVEMFGDQQTNPFDWDSGTIRDVVTEVKYGTSKPAVDGGQYKYLRMNNITYGGELDLSSLKYIDIEEKDYEKCVVRKGDVLFNRTNSKELVGKTCVFNKEEEMIIAGYIIRVRLNDKALPVYLSTLLNSQYGKETLAGMCKAIVGQANINAQELQDIKILIPPVNLQLEFKEFKKQVDKLKVEVQKSLDETQLLFDSLMQRYFD